MMRPRFSSGLVVGLAVGMPIGAIMVMLALPPRGGMTAEQVREIALLREDVEALREASAAPATGDAEVREALAQLEQERGRVTTQLGLFEELANQVSGGLARLQMRLDALERREAAPPPQQPQRYRDGWE